jgi:hypothetical protein
LPEEVQPDCGVHDGSLKVGQQGRLAPLPVQQELDQLHSVGAVRPELTHVRGAAVTRKKSSFVYLTTKKKL